MKRSAKKSTFGLMRSARRIRRRTSFTASRFTRSKYGAATTVYEGSRYHSKKEAAYARKLDLLRHAQDDRERVVEWRRQIKVPLHVNGVLIANYYCDFLVSFADGREEWHEVKGFETEVWRLKEKLFRAVFPMRILKVIR